MAVSDQPVTIRYATDGSSVAFAFPYYFAAAADLVVTVQDSTGAVTTKTITTDYTVSGTLDTKLNVYSSGGTVTFGVAPATGGYVRITRRTPRSQPVVYNPHDPFPAGSHEQALDRLMLVVQDALTAMGCIGIADGPPTSGTFLNGQWLKNANLTPGGTMGWVYIGGHWYEWGQISQ